MPGTEYFQNKVKNSLNALSNDAAAWKPDTKFEQEAASLSQRVQYELESGILTKYRVLRTRQLEQVAAQNCYGNKSYTFLEAEQCEKFLMQNDFKLNLIKDFYKDHHAKHYLSHQACADQANEASTIVGKDKAYADCHNAWVSDFKQNQSQELEARARALIGKGLE